MANKKSSPIKTNIEFVLISLCTCKRPKLLLNSLLSIKDIQKPDKVKVEILVVDNDVEQTGKDPVLKAEQEIDYKLHYIVEPERGISNARNKVLKEAINLGASHILFFDDDELLTSSVLIKHIELYQNSDNVYISSGPTYSKFAENTPDYIKKHMVFKQNFSKKTGTVKTECAAGNVFFPVSIAKEYNLRFGTEYKFMGGEDGNFFNKASSLGFTIVWNKEAEIYEIVMPARANMKYILKKCYYNGYRGIQNRFKTKKKSCIYILKLIIVLFLNILLLPFSFFCGRTVFFNSLGNTVKMKGKVDGFFSNKPCNFYEEIYGE